LSNKQANLYLKATPNQTKAAKSAISTPTNIQTKQTNPKNNYLTTTPKPQKKIVKQLRKKTNNQE
jgi:hypothetical protein